MGRRDPDERKAHKKGDQDKKKDGQEQEQDQEQQNEKQKEPEHVRAQNQLGNQALNAMMQQGPGGKGGGIEVEMAKKKVDMEKEGQGFGGEDDEGDPVAIVDGDLGESWNPTTTHPSDRVAFLEAMPEDELPAEDPELIEALNALGELPRLPSTASVEPLIQPSPEVLAVSTQHWTRAIARLAGLSLAERAWAHLLVKPGPLLQDPAGRVLILRTRTAALAANALLHGPTLAGRDVGSAALVSFALELEARGWRVRAGRIALGDNTARALARATLELVLPEAEREERNTPRALDGVGAEVLDRALVALLDLEDPHGLVPDDPETSAPAADEDDDDPLGMDAVIAEFTGGAQDPREGAYRAFLQSADKVANAVYIARVRLAGVAVAVADTARLWSGGAPGGSLLDVCADFDAVTGEIIALLKDVARAANKRNVALKTLRAWLDKAADKLVDGLRAARAGLVAVIGGVLPGEARLPPLGEPPLDDLSDAWMDGRPEAALPWLRAQPESLDRDLAVMFTRLATAWEPEGLPSELSELRERAQDEGKTHLADALATLLGCTLLAAGRFDNAIDVGRMRFDKAIARRNGVVAAEAALLQVEGLWALGRHQEAAEFRVRAAAYVWRLGTRGALTLIARWRPPADER